MIISKQVGNVPRGIIAQLFCIVKLQILAVRSLGKDSVSQPFFSQTDYKAEQQRKSNVVQYGFWVVRPHSGEICHSPPHNQAFEMMQRGLMGEKIGSIYFFSSLCGATKIYSTHRWLFFLNSRINCETNEFKTPVIS